MKLKWILGLVTAVIFSLGLNGAHADEPDATLRLRVNSFALGFGFSWGSGTLTYEGKDYPVEIQGFSLANVGGSRTDTVARVYNLNNLEDFNGNYAGVDGGLTLGGGASAAAVRNENGVNVVFVSTTRGLEFAFGFTSVVMNVTMPEAAAAAPAPAAAPATFPILTPAVEPTKVHFATDEWFDFDKAVLKPGSSRYLLDEFAAKLKTFRYDSIKIVGYTDRIGSDVYNNHLSRLRAESVRNYLVTRGVDSRKMSVEGRGKADSITGSLCQGDRRTPALIACLQPDRRVEVQVDGIQQAS